MGIGDRSSAMRVLNMPVSLARLTREQVVAAFKREILLAHPDKVGTQNGHRTQTVLEARDYLFRNLAPDEYDTYVFSREQQEREQAAARERAAQAFREEMAAAKAKSDDQAKAEREASELKARAQKEAKEARAKLAAEELEAEKKRKETQDEWQRSKRKAQELRAEEWLKRMQSPQATTTIQKDIPYEPPAWRSGVPLAQRRASYMSRRRR
jgi:hypothetical protein